MYVEGPADHALSVAAGASSFRGEGRVDLPPKSAVEVGSPIVLAGAGGNDDAHCQATYNAGSGSMAKAKIPNGQLKRKITLLCEDCHALCADIRHLADFAHNPQQALSLAIKIEEIALAAVA